MTATLSKSTRWRLLLLLLVILVVALGVLCWRVEQERRLLNFQDELNMVGFSTSMIAQPTPAKEREALQQADDAGIDLLWAYQRSQEHRARFDLAWLLISQESPEYVQFAKEHIATVPWPEARIWAVRRRDKKLSPHYRQELLDLMLASPTSEAKLAVARWSRSQGKIEEAEDAFYAAMTTGLYWDALDAADELLQSERYRRKAIDHLYHDVETSKYFTPRTARSLARHFDAEEQLAPLIEECEQERQAGPRRQLLLGKFSELMKPQADK